MWEEISSVEKNKEEEWPPSYLHVCALLGGGVGGSFWVDAGAL